MEEEADEPSDRQARHNENTHLEHLVQSFLSTPDSFSFAASSVHGHTPQDSSPRRLMSLPRFPELAHLSLFMLAICGGLRIAPIASYI